VLVVDDHASFAEALAIAMETQDDLECVGTAHDVEQALALVEERSPEVVLMDVNLPGADGVDGTRRIKALRPETRVLILTSFARPEVLARAATAGAAGFLPKESGFADVLSSIRASGEDQMIVDRVTLEAMLERVSVESSGGGAAPSRPRLTAREYEVLRRLGEGLDPQAIARELSISVHTCRGHVKSVLQKLGAHSQLEAVVMATRQGILEAPRP
jgi:DNA-binding NarL/FixJ family response regulator